MVVGGWSAYRVGDAVLREHEALGLDPPSTDRVAEVIAAWLFTKCEFDLRDLILTFPLEKGE